MFDESDREFHERRARDELDLAYRSESHRAMAAHFRLSALHLVRLGLAPAAPELVFAERLSGERGSGRAPAGPGPQVEPGGEAGRVSR